MDNPAEVLYWVLSQGQRHHIAHQLGVCKAQDQARFSTDCQRAQIWLRRLRRRGSLDHAMRLAERLHRHNLRRLEDAIRLADIRHGWREELEAWRTQHYHLLELASVPRGSSPWAV
jgi:hypothetical protein